MRIEVNKNELAGALNALGKLICRTSPVEAYRSVQITGREGKLHFRTAGKDECIEFMMDAEMENEFSVLVGFEPFRQAVRGSRNRSLAFELTDEHLTIDGMQMTLLNCEFPKVPDAPDDVKSEQLPDSFIELLGVAAPVVNRNEYRKILQGINLSSEGITTTNGKELFNVYLPMHVESLTIPFPLALIATKATGVSALSYWTNGINVFFQIEVGNWRWSGKALAGIYPNWQKVVPDRKSLTHSVSFTTECAEELKSWLKLVPDDPPNNGIELCQRNDSLSVRSLKGMETSVDAEFGDVWNDYRLVLNRDILLRLLSEGHTRIECQADHGPFLATGGIGKYVAMPLSQKVPKPTSSESANEPTHTNDQKEKETVIDTNTTVVSAPVQTVAPNHEPEPALNPLDDLSASIEAFKAKMKASFDEVAALARKVKEAQIAQKQKERDFIQARRAIERIRMVSGF